MIYRLVLGVCLAVFATGCGGNGAGAVGTPTQEPAAGAPLQGQQASAEPEEEPPPMGGGVAAPNPAATYCIEQGGELERIDTGTAQYGICVFKDGSRCAQWSFVRGECAPGKCFDKMGKCEQEKAE